MSRIDQVLRRASLENGRVDAIPPTPFDPEAIVNPLDGETWELELMEPAAEPDVPLAAPDPVLFDAPPPLAEPDALPVETRVDAAPLEAPAPPAEPVAAAAAPIVEPPIADVAAQPVTPQAAAPQPAEPQAVEPPREVATADAPATPAVPQGVDVLVTRTTRMDAVEQYRKMAAALHEARQDRNLRSVLCTSALMGEGKTITACNLALTLAESYGRRVLLIDADLRRPAVHTMFQIPNEDGLNEALTGADERKLAVRSVTPLLSIVTAGARSSDPMKGLTSERLRSVIEQATAKFDWVIVDTPPVLLLPDARVLVSMVDAVVMVVQAAQTPFRTVVRAVDVVRRERVFGVVLNNAEEQALDSYYGYRTYYAPTRA